MEQRKSFPRNWIIFVLYTATWVCAFEYYYNSSGAPPKDDQISSKSVLVVGFWQWHWKGCSSFHNKRLYCFHAIHPLLGVASSCDDDVDALGPKNVLIPIYTYLSDQTAIWERAGRSKARTTVNGDCIHLGITTRYYGHSDAKRMVKMVHAKMRSKELWPSGRSRWSREEGWRGRSDRCSKK